MHLWLCSCDGMHVSRLISDENSDRRREKEEKINRDTEMNTATVSKI